MTENKINITDMIKALKCVASQDAEGDCYCDHFNAHLTCEQFADNARLDEKHMSCGGILKDTQSCPYSQKTYGVCYEDGELFWLKDVVGMLEEIQQYRAIGTVEGYKRAVKVSKENYYLCAEYKARLKEYEAIGTIEEFKALKEKSTPKKAEYKKMVYPSHKWKEENGKIDVWAYEAGYCNGPVCERCYYSFCEHCNPNGYEGECVVEDYICPSCRENVGYKQTHCKCGQKLDWSE